MNTELEAFLKRVNLDIVSYETTRTLKLADIEYAQKDVDATKEHTWERGSNIVQVLEEVLANKQKDLEDFLYENKEMDEIKKYYAEYQECEKKLKALLEKEPANANEKSRNEFSIEELKFKQKFIIERLRALTKNRSLFNTDDLEKENPKKEEPEKDDPKRDNPEKDDPERDNPEKDDPKRDDPEKDDPERDDPEIEDSESEIEKELQSRPRTIEVIMAELNRGLDFKVKDKRAYNKLTLRKIKIRDEFEKNVHTGNLKYNIAGVSKSFRTMMNKVVSNILGATVKQEQIDKINNLEERLNNLPEKDLETILKDGTASFFKQSMYPEAFTAPIVNRMKKYCQEKIDALNMTNKKIFSKIAGDYLLIEGINKELEGDLTEEKRTHLEDERANLYDGKAELLKEFTSNQDQANYYIGGGSHGFEEIVRATTIGKGMNYVGYADAVKHGNDQKLMDQEAILSADFKKAIEEGNDELAVSSFIERQRLEAENTSYDKKRFVGEVSTGKRSYTPMATLLDYSQDTHIRDIMGTIALGTAAVSSIHGIVTHLIDNPNLVAEINQKLNDVEDQIHSIGNDITSKRDDFGKGMTANSYANQVGAVDIRERQAATLDGHTYDMNSADYWAADKINHQTSHNEIENMNSQFTDAMNDLKDKRISDSEYLNKIAEVASEVNKNQTKLYENTIEQLREYQANNPQFDLSSTIDSMDYIIKNHDAVAKFNNGIVEVYKDGEVLKTLEVPQLDKAGSDLLTTLISAGATMAYCDVVDKEVGKKKAMARVPYKEREKMLEYEEMLYDNEISTGRSR